MKNWWWSWSHEVFFVIAMLFVGNGILGFFAILDKSMVRTSKSCDAPHRRVEYLVPGWMVGCWLGDFPNER